MESRTSSALFKRAEQLRRWEESDTNREPPVPNLKTRRIKFSDGCVFLSACAAGDKEEVLKLIQQGADIDTPNVDGLTALHQACIDDNLDMVEFLVAHGADINRGDHEGWTPLHATASCGFLSIARFLIDNGADLAVVNNDGELPLDIAETEAMEELLEKETHERAIDCDNARSREERQMLEDVARWLEGDPDASSLLRPHPRTGATALHVAAAKGYIRVMGMLIQGNMDLNAQDFDGWTALHAAAHWGQREACQLLCENMAEMEIRNYVGQTCFDVADPDVLRLLEDCKKRQAAILRERPEIRNNKLASKSTAVPKRRSSVTRLSQSEKAAVITSSKMVDKITPGPKVAEEEVENSTESGAESTEDESTLKEPNPVEKRSSLSQSRTDAFKDATSSKVPLSAPPSRPPPSVDLESSAVSSSSPTRPADGSNDVPSWRRAGSVRSKQTSGSNGDRDSLCQPTVSSSPSNSTPSSSVSSVSSSGSTSSGVSAEAEVTLRRAHSFESDDRFYARLQELRRRIQTSSLPLLSSSSSTDTLASSSSLSNTATSRHDLGTSRAESSPAAEQTSTTATVVLSTQSTSPSQTTVRSVATLSLNPPASPSVTTVKLSPGAVIKNFFKSFVPPVRDEESETQRKAHAKRVRETRRSTQGVTLEEVKSAEQLVKKHQVETPSSNDSERAKDKEDQPQDSRNEGLERRPSWRLCVSDTNKNKFSLEDSRSKNNGNTVSVVAITTSTTTLPTTSQGEADTVVTIPLRRGKAQEEEKDASSANSSAAAIAAAAATQAAIQRRRRPKRRSTGVVQIDMDDLDPSKESPHSAENDGQSDDSEALSDRASNSSSRPSRPSSLASSTSDLRDEPSTPATPASTNSVAATAAAVASGAINANGEIDYKKLWEDSQLENERLRERLRVSQEDLGKYKEQLEKALQVSNARNAMTEAEKRERRALERKLSEMEEELKQSEQREEQLRADNSRLRDENGALIRVISKLSK